MNRMFSAIGLAALLTISQAAAAPMSQTKVTDGIVQGSSQGPVEAFLGIPYAAPPVGPLRWRPPEPAAPWKGVLKADHFAANCYQMIIPGAGGFGPWTTEYLAHGPVSENCLYLNVWTPAASKGKHLPVLFWIYGGGFSQGSGSVPIYDGAALAAKGIVVVNVNYRLGVFGFLAHPELTAESPDHSSGNYGLLDVIAALKWVRANIAAFGGDPDAITVAGQSAGAGTVLDLDVSPLAKGLYARAIAESGAGLGLPMPDLKTFEQQGVAFAEKKGATSLAELRALPPDKLVGNMMQGGVFFAPIVDGWVIPDAPQKLIAEGRYNDTPFLTGLTANEASGMNPKYGSLTTDECQKAIEKAGGSLADRFAKLYFDAASCNEGVKQLDRDRGLASTFFWSMDRLKTAKQPVYLYLYDHPEPGPDAAHYGAFHSSEIPYVFRTLDKSPDRPFTDEDRAISDKMSAYWVDFVKSGNPNGDNLPLWPNVDATSKQIMELGNQFEARPVLPPEKLELMQDYVAQGGKLGLF